MFGVKSQRVKELEQQVETLNLIIRKQNDELTISRTANAELRVHIVNLKENVRNLNAANVRKTYSNKRLREDVREYHKTKALHAKAAELKNMVKTTAKTKTSKKK